MSERQNGLRNDASTLERCYERCQNVGTALGSRTGGGRLGLGRIHESVLFVYLSRSDAVLVFIQSVLLPTVIDSGHFQLDCSAYCSYQHQLFRIDDLVQHNEQGTPPLSSAILNVSATGQHFRSV